MSKANPIYQNPRYYEIAFSFRNIKKEVDFIEECIRKFSEIRVKNVIELACGHSPHMFELIKRGYDFTGLDLNKKMLNYSKERARRKGIEITTIHGDINNFKTEKKFDLAYVMLASIFIEKNKDLLAHLDCVAHCLRKSSLYLLDGIITFDWNNVLHKDSWTIKKRGIKVKTTWEFTKPMDFVTQTCTEKGKLEIKENDKRKILKEKRKAKIIFPQEFLALIQLNDKFEFLGWYPNFTLKPLKIKKGSNARIITILRRK